MSQVDSVNTLHEIRSYSEVHSVEARVYLQALCSRSSLPLCIVYDMIQYSCCQLPCSKGE
jgi:hypothetical protein